MSTTKWIQLGLATLAGAGIATLALTAPLGAQSPWRWMPMGWHMENLGDRGPGYPGGGPGRGNGPCVNGGAFDTTAIETLSGTVTEVNRYGGHQGMVAVLQTNDGTVEVHLGPLWYLESQGFEVTLNSPMEVTGFRSQFTDRAVILASEIKQGDRVLQLRDANGYPVWMRQERPAN